MGEHTIKLIDDTLVPGSAPLVLIGPNGSGKSRMAATLASRHNYQLIAAKRDHSIQIQGTRTPEFGRSIRDSLSKILTEFLDEEHQAATRFTQRHRVSPTTAGDPPITRVSKLIQLFETIFPGRQLNLDSRQPSAAWIAETKETEEYPAISMSDGEKAGVDLIARLLWADSGVVIVDEPEVHFHSLLARDFWTRVENFRPDCRFIYVTHDLPFALSRIGARIGIVRDERTVDLVPEDSAIPEDLVERLLGAATISVVAKRIVFCEGKSSGSIDHPFYSAWFRADQSVVAPVGGCEQVRRAVSAMNECPILSNASILGVIDRDYWPDSYLVKLANEGLFVLPFHELEALFCAKEVASAIGSHLGKASINDEYDNFLQSVRDSVKGVELSKLILERSKRVIEIAVLGLGNSAKPDKDLAVTKSNLTSAVDITRTIPDVGELFDAQTKEVEIALNGSEVDLLRLLPGKHCLSLLSQKLGITREAYGRLIQKALCEVEGGQLAQLRERLIVALEPHLPER